MFQSLGFWGFGVLGFIASILVLYFFESKLGIKLENVNDCFDLQKFVLHFI